MCVYIFVRLKKGNKIKYISDKKIIKLVQRKDKILLQKKIKLTG